VVRIHRQQGKFTCPRESSVFDKGRMVSNGHARKINLCVGEKAPVGGNGEGRRRQMFRRGGSKDPRLSSAATL